LGSVGNNTITGGNLTVNGSTSLVDNVTMSKNLTVTGNTLLGSVGNNTITGGNLTVNGSTSLVDNVTMSKNLTVTGNTLLGSVGNETIIGGNLTVNGNVTYKGTITHVDTTIETLEVNEAFIAINCARPANGGHIQDTGLYVNAGSFKSGLIRLGGNSYNPDKQLTDPDGLVGNSSTWALLSFNFNSTGTGEDSLADGVYDKLLVSGVYVQSDERLKTDITLLDNALEKINKLKGVTYNWKDGHGKTEIGVIAQDIQGQFPELVYSGQEFLMVDYPRITAVLIEGVKELDKENKELREMIKDIYEKMEQNKCKCEKTVAEEVAVEEAPKRRGRKPKETSSPSSTSSLTSSESDETPKRRGRKPKVVVE
jgi:hypothetical protein